MGGMDEAVSISEARRQFYRLIARVVSGETIVIRRGKSAVAKIVPVNAPICPVRPVFGALRGQIWVADDFDDMGPEWDEHTCRKRSTE